MSLRNLGERTIAASAQIMSIVGGAIAPPLMGWLAEAATLEAWPSSCGT
jgi:fucose permease